MDYITRLLEYFMIIGIKTSALLDVFQTGCTMSFTDVLLHLGPMH